MSKKKSKNKAKAGSDLKKQIRAMIDSAYKQNKQIDRKAIKARFLAEHPNKQQSINDIVNT
jgi:hypothetical protein